MKNRVPLPASCLIELIDSQRFGVEYQPIIDLQSCEIFAYECLARFFDQKISLSGQTSFMPHCMIAP